MELEVLENPPLNPDDYKNEDGSFEITNFLRDLHRNSLEKTDIDRIRGAANLKDTVTLFHGTTSARLNGILQNGLRPRKETSIDNYQSAGLSSAENTAYLTNKWHYMYAYQTTDIYLAKEAKREKEEPKAWWETWKSVPCYVECEVPKALMVADEDFYHSQYVAQKVKAAVKRGNIAMDLGWQESLAHYATAGVLGGVPPEYIKSFSVLGEAKLQHELMIENSRYQRDFKKWSSGKGKGEMKLREIQQREDASLLNGMWTMDDIPKGMEISQIGMNPKNNKIAIVFNPRKE